MILNVEVRLVRDEDNKWRSRVKSSLIGESQPGLIHGKETGVTVPAAERPLYLFRSNLYLELGDEIEKIVKDFVSKANAEEIALRVQKRIKDNMKKEEKQ